MSFKNLLKRSPTLASAVAIACVLGNPNEKLIAQGRNDKIVTSSESLPGVLGTFSPSMVNATMNDAGQVAFQAQSLIGTPGGNSDNEGLFLGSGGGLTQIARRGQTVPGGNGSYLVFAGTPQVDVSGRVGFLSLLSGTSGGTADDGGVFLGNGTTTLAIARDGQAVAGVGSIFSATSSSVMNNSGRIAFSASLTGTSGGTADNQGIFSGNGGSLTQIVRKGQSAAGNGTFSVLNLLAINGAGQTFFASNLAGSSGGATDDTGLYLGNGGVVEQIAREGQSVPGGNGAFGFFSTAIDRSLNDSGRVAFGATLTATSGGTSDNAGIFLGGGGSMEQIVRKGQSVAGGNGTYSSFVAPVLNNANQLAFVSNLAGTSGGTADDDAIYRADSSSVVQIAREGQAAPVANGVFSTLSGVQMNQKGNVAFRGDLTGTSGGAADNVGLFIGDGIDLLQIVRKGESLQGSTITSMNMAATDGINDNGQVAYQANLANGRTTIQRWTPNLHWRVNSSGAFDDSAKWTLGLGPSRFHDVFVDSAGSLTVTGPATDRTIRSLTIGGGTGQAKFSLQNGAVLTANGVVSGVTVANKGTLTGDGVIAGSVTNNLGGTILADNLTITNTITNNGLILGNGFIEANIVNNASGKIRALGGDVMHLAGPALSNSGLIEVNASELQIDGAVTNQASTGLISVRNGSLIADAGIANQGSLAMTLGNSTIQGDIDNTGTIQVSGGAHSTFFGDLVQNGTLQVSSIGSTVSTAVLLGSFSGSGGFIGGGDVFALGDLRPGNSPASVLFDGNLFLGTTTDTFIELGGLGIGAFDQMLVSGDLTLAGELFVSLIDGFTLGANEQFLIGDVGDVLSGQFFGLSEGSLVGNFGGQNLFITYAAGNGNDIGLFTTAIPEPGSGLILVGLITGVTFHRRRRTTQGVYCQAKPSPA